MGTAQVQFRFRRFDTEISANFIGFHDRKSVKEPSFGKILDLIERKSCAGSVSLRATKLLHDGFNAHAIRSDIQNKGNRYAMWRLVYQRIGRKRTNT